MTSPSLFLLGDVVLLGCETLCDFSLTSELTWFVPPFVDKFIGQILLRNPSTWIIMRVVVSRAMSKGGGTLVVSVSQMRWYFAYCPIFDVGSCAPYGEGSSIALRGRGEVDRGMGQIEFGLR
jgi:hypothetical protein